MSRLTRALALVAMLAAMNLAAVTAVAQAHTRTDPATGQPAGNADATVQRLLARERFTVPTAAPAHPRLLLEEQRSSLLNLPGDEPAPATSPIRPTEHSGRPGWLAPALTMLALVMTVIAVAAVLVGRRAHRIQRASQTA
jgi:hypothetical protein